MSETTSSSSSGVHTGVQAGVPSQTRRHAPEPTGWVGWIVFAASMMILLGIFHAIEGLVALFKDEYFVVGTNGLVVDIDYTAWGWAHLIGGIVVALAGMALFTGRTWARVVGVVVAMVSAIINIAFLAAYPVWSTIMIAIDVLVIYALTAHGAEMKSL
jgi:hypothetical protein